MIEQLPHPLFITFTVDPDTSKDIQMMTVWRKALEHFEINPREKIAAVEWIYSYVKDSAMDELQEKRR